MFFMAKKFHATLYLYLCRDCPPLLYGAALSTPAMYTLAICMNEWMNEWIVLFGVGADLIPNNLPVLNLVVLLQHATSCCKSKILSFVGTPSFQRSCGPKCVFCWRELCKGFYIDITGCAVAQHCCNDDQQSQWENGDFDPCRSETPKNFITKIGHID